MINNDNGGVIAGDDLLNTGSVCPNLNYKSHFTILGLGDGAGVRVYDDDKQEFTVVGQNELKAAIGSGGGITRCRYANIMEGREYAGTVLQCSENLVVQNIGKEAILHSKRHVSGDFSVGDSVVVKYGRDGLAEAMPRVRGGGERGGRA